MLSFVRCIRIATRWHPKLLNNHAFVRALYQNRYPLYHPQTLTNQSMKNLKDNWWLGRQMGHYAYNMLILCLYYAYTMLILCLYCARLFWPSCAFICDHRKRGGGSPSFDGFGSCAVSESLPADTLNSSNNNAFVRAVSKSLPFHPLNTSIIKLCIIHKH